MNNLNLFIIKSSLILFVFYIGFWLFLRKSSYFKLNRIYLLSGLILSLIIPFLNFQLHESAQTEIFITLDSIDISSNKILNTSQNAIDWFGFFPIFYYSIAVLLTFKFLFQLFSLINLFLHSEKEKQNGFNLILTNKNNANFSFFNYAFVNKKNRNSESYSAIIKHEFVHIVQKHSVDIILAEIVTIVLWFNPFAWLYKKSIKENHEYIADAEVINNSLSVIEYQKILFEQSFGVNFSIANSFNSSLTFKRLNMMKKIKSNKYMKYRVLITLPAILLMIVFVSFSNENNSTIIKNVNPLSVNQDIDLSENLSLIDDTFFIVEKMPEFPGGEFGLRKFIATNIKYPESARDNGIAGKVFIRFAVTKDGSVDNVHVARSVDQLLDEEAIRVVKLLKGWKPGEQKGEKVNVWFIVPINFALK